MLLGYLDRLLGSHRFWSFLAEISGREGVFTSLFQLEAASKSAVGEKDMEEIESLGGLASSKSFSLVAVDIIFGLFLKKKVISPKQ